MDYYLQVNLWRCVSSTCSSTPSVGSSAFHAAKLVSAQALKRRLRCEMPSLYNCWIPWCPCKKPAPGDPVWPKTSQLFRQEFRRMCVFFGFISQQFKPYSLCRGGATFLLQAGMPLESILLRGRWKSLPSGDSTLRTDWRNSRRCALLRRCNCELLAGRRKLLPRPFGHNF